MSDDEKQESISIDKARVKKFAIDAGLTVAQVEALLKHKMTLDTGYYFDNGFPGELRMVIWFRLALQEQAKKDYVERPRHGAFKKQRGAPAYFGQYSDAAKEVVQVASETFSQYMVRQMPADLVAKIIDRSYREIMSEWSKLN